MRDELKEEMGDTEGRAVTDGDAEKDAVWVTTVPVAWLVCETWELLDTREEEDG
jgi:hypothetical protein